LIWINFWHYPGHNIVLVWRFQNCALFENLKILKFFLCSFLFFKINSLDIRRANNKIKKGAPEAFSNFQILKFSNWLSILQSYLIKFM